MGSAVLVRFQERLVVFFEVLGFGEELVEVCVDYFCGLSGEGLGDSVEGFAELEELEVESWVCGVDCVGGCETLQSREIFVCE